MGHDRKRARFSEGFSKGKSPRWRVGLQSESEMLYSGLFLEMLGAWPLGAWPLLAVMIISAICLANIHRTYFVLRKLKGNDSEEVGTPESVNYHFTRQCNYQCGFCFHTAKTSFVLPLDEAKRGLKMLKDAGSYSDGVL